MGIKQEKARIKQLKQELNAARRDYTSGVRVRNYRLLKFALFMVVLVIIASLVYGRIQI